MGQFKDFGELVSHMALNAIGVQEIWNQAHALELEQFAHVLASGATMADWVLPLAPVRLALDHFEVDAAVQIEVSRRTEFNLGCQPINLQYVRRFQTEEQTASRIRITVAQTPLPTSTEVS
jgi:hypothetical protein